MKITNRYFLRNTASSLLIKHEILKVVDDMGEMFGIIIPVHTYNPNDKDKVAQDVSVIEVNSCQPALIDVPNKYLDISVGRDLTKDMLDDYSGVAVVRWEDNLISTDNDVYVASLSLDDLNY